MEMILTRLRNKMTSRMTESWVEDVFIANEDEDLSSWEIVNPSDGENADISFDDDDGEDDVSVIESLSSDISSQSPPENLIRPPEMEIDGHDRRRRKELSTELSIVGRFGYNYQYYQHHHDGEDEDEEGSYEYEDELDDELVPRSVSDRFLRNRIRKLGKREYSKMAKSKRLSNLYNRPGCVRGKHGLGLKHSLM